jgi:hypothetical protein
MKPSMLTGSSEGVLSRSEMKMIMAGSGFSDELSECEEGNDCTNCLICENSDYCVSYPDIPPAPGCTYGICPQC